MGKGKYSTPASRAKRDAEIARQVKAGGSEREIALNLGVSRTTVWTVKQALKAVDAAREGDSRGLDATAWAGTD